MSQGVLLGGFGDLGIARGGDRRGMPHGLLNGAQIQSGLDQAGAVGVAQTVGRDTFLNAGVAGDEAEGLLYSAAMHRDVRVGVEIDGGARLALSSQCVKMLRVEGIEFTLLIGSHGRFLMEKGAWDRCRP